MLVWDLFSIEKVLCCVRGIHPVNIYIEHHHLSHTKYIHKSFELNTILYKYIHHRNIYVYMTLNFKSSQNFAKHNFP